MMIFKKETLLLLSLVGSITLLPNLAHAKDKEHYYGIRSLKGGKKGSKGGSGDKKGGKKNGSKRMSCEEIPHEMVDSFMSVMMMKSDSTADMMNTMQDMSKDGTFMVGGNMYSMDDMQPIDLLTADATIDVDGEELDPRLYPRPSVFGSNANGMSMLVTTTLEGDVETVFEFDAEGTTTAQMEAISPGCMVTITPEMMDKEKLSEFSLGGDDADPPENARMLETASRESDPTTARQLRPCDQLRVIEVSFGLDSSFCRMAGGRSAAIAKVGKIVAWANQKYAISPICARIAIKFCDIQCNASYDRYNTAVANESRSINYKDQNQDNFLDFFQKTWRTNPYLNNRKGDATHLFSGTNIHPGKVLGLAWTRELCSIIRSFGVNEIIFSRNLALQASVFAHELGHNAGM
jgi:hypothetical protein